MVWKVDWDGGFVVGGDGSRRLTPSFRLKEFRKPDGSIRVHRELVSALQMLRDSFGKALSVRRTDEDGLGATVSGEPIQELLQAAERVKAHHLFNRVEEQKGIVHLVIPDPDRLPEIELAQALETAFSITAAFETSGDKFQQVAGNFDGAGVSFGPAQVNFKSGTLAPLFKKFQAADENAFRECFTDADDYEEWVKVMNSPVSEQIAWANTISTGSRGYDVIEPWKSYFRAVGRVERFRVIMAETILRDYGRKLLDAIKYLQKVRPDIQIDHLRCICSLYDLVIQQGSLSKAERAIEERVKRENPKDQFDLVRIAVEERSRTALAEWQADCESRRVGILSGVPVTIADRQRANINFYLLRDVRIRGARDFANADFTEPLARASHTVATGSTLMT
jgi:hypothetical protein